MKNTLARWISILAHPFVIAIVTVGIGAFRSAPREEAMRLVVTFAVIAILPILWLSIRQVRRGKWEHIDASKKSERPILYIAGIGATLVLFLYLRFTNPDSHFIRTIPIVLGALALCGLVVRWVKISLHVFFVALAAGALLSVFFAALVPVVAWSRLVLARHTLLEVILGALIGAATGYLITLS